jgi:hypothetical protein
MKICAFIMLIAFLGILAAIRSYYQKKIDAKKSFDSRLSGTTEAVENAVKMTRQRGVNQLAKDIAEHAEHLLTQAKKFAAIDDWLFADEFLSSAYCQALEAMQHVPAAKCKRNNAQ